MNDETIQSVEESFQIDYFLFVVDEAILHFIVGLKNLQNIKIS